MVSWAHEFGQAVRQLSNRQTTTMKKMGTLPDYMATRTLALQERVFVETEDEINEDAIDSEQNSDTEDEAEEEKEEDGGSEEEHSDQDDWTDTLEEEPPALFDEQIYDQRPAYLIGAVSRSGRPIKLNNIYTDILR